MHKYYTNNETLGIILVRHIIKYIHTNEIAVRITDDRRFQNLKTFHE